MRIAKARGARVTALASAAHHDLVRELGADEIIDHRTTAPPKRSRTSTSSSTPAPRASAPWTS
ncbi:hypothetical protein [Streptomyces cinereoruber]